MNPFATFETQQTHVAWAITDLDPAPAAEWRLMIDFHLQTILKNDTIRL